MTTPNWWLAGSYWMARDTDGKLVPIISEDARDYIEMDDSDEMLQELDEIDPIVVSGNCMALTESGAFYIWSAARHQYVEVTALGPIAYIHYDVVETCAGKFFKGNWSNDPEIKWVQCEPKETQDRRDLDEFEREFSVNCGNGVIKYTKVQYNRGVYRRIETRTDVSQNHITSAHRTIIDHNYDYILTDDGEVRSMYTDELIQRIMVHKKHTKSAN